MRIKEITMVSVTVALAILTNGCSPYSNTRKLNEKTSIGYADASARSASKTGGRKIASVGAAELGTYLIGLIFKEADKAATRARTSDFEAIGRRLSGTGTFPESGYLVLARTVSDPENKYPEIASANDLINGIGGTAGGELAATISEDTRISAKDLGDTLRESLGSGLGNDEKIAMLVLCEVLPLRYDSDRVSKDLYGVSFSGMYYPLLSGSRFAGESSDVFTRISNSKEAMLLEVYGPNGSGFTTGIVKVPLAWTPPARRGEPAPWITQANLIDAYGRTHSEDQIKELKHLLDDRVDSRLARRQAFVVPGNLNRGTLRADYRVSETSEATGWISKAIDKAKKAAEKAVSGD